MSRFSITCKPQSTSHSAERHAADRYSNDESSTDLIDFRGTEGRGTCLAVSMNKAGAYRMPCGLVELVWRTNFLWSTPRCAFDESERMAGAVIIAYDDSDGL
jgi:hypothetical protein